MNSWTISMQREYVVYTSDDGLTLVEGWPSGWSVAVRTQLGDVWGLPLDISEGTAQELLGDHWQLAKACLDAIVAVPS